MYSFLMISNKFCDFFLMFGGAKPLFISFLYHIMYIHTHSFKTFVEFHSSDFLALAVATVQDGIEMWESVL
jgi:hypothetical protein